MPNQKKSPSQVNLLFEVDDDDEQGSANPRKNDQFVVKLKASGDIIPEHKCPHRQQCRVVVKKCSPTLFVGLDIKFTNKLHPLDGKKGLGTVHKINQTSPSATSKLELGDRVLTIFGKIIHTKQELLEILNVKRRKISKTLVQKKFYTVPFTIEKPCCDAKFKARRLAQRYVDQRKDEVRNTAAFEFHCDTCDDIVKFFVVSKMVAVPKKSRSADLRSPSSSSTPRLPNSGHSTSSGGGSRSGLEASNRVQPKANDDKKDESYQNLFSFCNSRKSCRESRVHNDNQGHVQGHRSVLL